MLGISAGSGLSLRRRQQIYPMPRFPVHEPASAARPELAAATADGSRALHPVWREATVQSGPPFGGSDSPLPGFTGVKSPAAANNCLLIGDHAKDNQRLLREIEKTVPAAVLCEIDDLPAFRSSLAARQPAVVILDWSVRFRRALALKRQMGFRQCTAFAL